ncbi:MAG: hypothetical protein JWP35_4091, partial [Caulobacter sp.]|nr:hypothetical protein [Caulobacter sp.]
LCQAMQGAPLGEDERQVAADILRIMAADAAEMVRRALAVTLQDSPLLPRDVALKLARDVESICLPVLTFSPAFTDDDLAQIVRLGGPVRQLAVAKRPDLGETVTRSITEHGSERAVAAVCANDSARFADSALQTALDRFGQSELVTTVLAYRKVLPMSVTERLITLVSDELRDHIVVNQALPPAMALRVAEGARERATLDLVDQAGRTQDPKAFAHHLQREGRLTPSLLLRALAHGHMGFFEHGLAELAAVPHHRTWLMVHDAGPLGFKAVYERAGLPARLFEAFRAGVDTYHAVEREEAPGDRFLFQERMLQRYLTSEPTAPREDMDYLMDRMDILAKAPRPGAKAIRRPPPVAERAERQAMRA